MSNLYKNSMWINGTNGVAHTQEAWIKGKFINPEKTVKIYDTKQIVGNDHKATKVKVYLNPDGTIFGHPFYEEGNEWSERK